MTGRETSGTARHEAPLRFVPALVAAADTLNRISPSPARVLYAGIWGTTLATAVLLAPLLAGWCLAAGGHLLIALVLTGCGLSGAAVCLPLKALTKTTLPSPAA
ncbi:hypothetical protein QF035_008996 [Streptomyces umbrinus]|uniref:Integral membrane protein n=1 Tax=Streptomyces umbrinus TaxID=67370 RepID=A0ABU0T6I0_9ACTN|nr:hypothetical protein [Streptomyces umbrinus]MDQ1031414.1 hypothetical protein [Streptomyces umbrinus]